MNILIEEKIDKEPYYKKISDDNIINVTGGTGAGKSTFCEKYKNDNYIYIDTDEVKDERPTSNPYCAELKKYLIKKYGTLPNIVTDFSTYYKEILNYYGRSDKPIVIDSAQFSNILDDDVNLLKGEVIVIRTSVDECYRRCIKRYIENSPTIDEAKFEAYKERKKGMYIWYKKLNDFILEIDKIKVKTK